MSDDKKYPFEFEKPVVTEREVDMYQVVMDKETNQPKLKVVKHKIQETVTYHHVPEQTVACGKGTHNYVVIDPHKYIVKCTKCVKHWKLNPQYHLLKDGHIYQRDYNYLID